MDITSDIGLWAGLGAVYAESTWKTVLLFDVERSHTKRLTCNSLDFMNDLALFSNLIVSFRLCYS